MNIAINCRSFLNKQYTGIGRYAYNLVKSLSVIDQKNEYQLYVRKGIFDFNKRLPHFKGKNFIPRLDLFNSGPARLLKKVDVYHLPSPGGVEAPKGAKVIVTVHDVIFKSFPEGHTKDTIEAGERQFKEIKKRADKIVCCSRSTINDLKKYFQIEEERMALVYQGVDKEVFYFIDEKEQNLASQTLKRLGVNDSYILSVGTIEPRKNLIGTLKAFARLKERGDFLSKLVVVGMKGWKSDNIERLVENLKLKEDVVFLGYLTDQELRYLYNKAQVFVFPSFYEGFGFPILEAFCCGVPVVTSNVSSCPELALDAALCVDPHDSEQIADAIINVVSDKNLREELRQKGFQRAKDFSFHKTAEETLAVYSEVVGVRNES